MDVAAKTGTTDNSADRWLCGFTPYYTAACWFGYDKKEEVTGFAVNPAGQIWDAVMTDIHKDLAGSTFVKPSGIVEQTVCKSTGCLATTGCAGYVEMFTADNLPGKCEGKGGSQTICSETGKVATPYCSQYVATSINTYGGVVPKEKLQLWKAVNGSNYVGKGKIGETCPIHIKPKEEEKPKPKENKLDKKQNNTENKTPVNTNSTNTNTNTNKTNNTNTNGTSTTKPTQKPDAGTTTPSNGSTSNPKKQET